jgi:3-dehydroquinate synthase
MPPSPAPPSRPVRVALPGGRGYDVHFRPLADVPALLAGAGLAPGLGLVVTDASVGPLSLDRARGPLRAAGWRPEATAVPAGEASKSLHQLAALYDWALGLGLDRATPLLALGGGVVGDLAGFAAATLLRGLPLVHLPTSVIAQVDSAVGGKTGINHAAGKNLVGAFHQPRLVLADPATLATLPERDFRSGLAEVVKHALLEGEAAVARLEADLERVLAREPAALAGTIRRAAAFKAAVVAEDEREAGRRAVLNLGHTFAHAIEQAEGYGRLTHGEAVALGLRAALHLSASVRAGRVWTEPALPERFVRADRLAARLPLPHALTAPTEALLAAMGTDKKRAGTRLRFVVLDALGRPRVTPDVPPGAVEAAWTHARTVAGLTAPS